MTEIKSEKTKQNPNRKWILMADQELPVSARSFRSWDQTFFHYFFLIRCYASTSSSFSFVSSFSSFITRFRRHRSVPSAGYPPLGTSCFSPRHRRRCLCIHSLCISHVASLRRSNRCGEVSSHTHTHARRPPAVGVFGRYTRRPPGRRR